MIVTVEGEINTDGITGTASNVYFDEELQGPVVGLTVNSDGTQLTFTVFDVTVIADRSSTIFEDTSFDTLANNDLVEISGSVNSLGDIIATRIENNGPFISDSSAIELKGMVANASSTSFVLGNFTVNFDGTTDVSDLEGGTISNGLLVEVRGTLNGTTITADEIESETDVLTQFSTSQVPLTIEGVVTNFTSTSDFEVLGIPVDASAAIFEPTTLSTSITLDTVVYIEGSFNNGVFVATSITAEEGNIEIHAPVQAVDTINRTITLGLVNGSIIATLNNDTLLEDQTDIVANLTINDINVNDFLQVEAYQSGSQIIATDIRRDELDDQLLQGPVEVIVPNVSLSVLGITYPVDVNTQYEDINENVLTAIDFYNSISVGDLIKINDDEVSDGTANEVEFEN
jgi:hypothetical protein